MESEGRRLHALAAEAREKEQFFDSLDFNDQALIAYDAAGDDAGYAEGLACRSITLRVYANLHESTRILTSAKYEMMGSVAIAQKCGDPTALAMPLYNLAQLHEDLEEYDDAVKVYSEALNSMQSNPPERHNRPAVVANMKMHMTTCEYKAGDTTALERAYRALADLEAAEDEDSYNRDVWLSGAHGRLAEILRTVDPEKAREHLQKSKDIIDANPQLTIRKKQWEKLAATFQ